jgi:hypothetical protein
VHNSEVGRLNFGVIDILKCYSYTLVRAKDSIHDTIKDKYCTRSKRLLRVQASQLEQQPVPGLEIEAERDANGYRETTSARKATPRGPAAHEL